jgi:hypothetical protein
MSDLHVSPAETGKVRVFALDLPAAEIPAFMARRDDTDDPMAAWPLRAALGADHLEAERVDLVRLADLEGVGLSGYLAEGLGVAAGEVARDRARLDALKDHALILPSSAFGGVKQHLAPRPPLRHVATLLEERPQAPGILPESASARPQGDTARPAAADGTDPAPRRAPARPLIIGAAVVLAAILILVLALAGR